MARRALLICALCLLIPLSMRADGAHDLLTTVAEKYDSLTNYLLEGSEITKIADTPCIVDMRFQISRTDQPAGSVDTPGTSLPTAIRFTASRLPEHCREAAIKLGSIRSPAEWAEFASVDLGVSDTRIVSQETLSLHGERFDCTVLEVLYDDYYQKIKSLTGPIRYWIDTSTHLVRRVEFEEDTAKGPRLWTATIEKVTFGGPTPSWVGLATILRAQPTLMGKIAPDFSLRTSRGQVARLSDLRGRVVLLNFWATWCLACEEEIPALEKLQTEWSDSQVVVLGVSDEEMSVVRKWLEQNHRSFRTVTGAKRVFRSFGVKPIPLLVVIDRRGVIVEYLFGFSSERRLREIVAKLVG